KQTGRVNKGYCDDDDDDDNDDDDDGDDDDANANYDDDDDHDHDDDDDHYNDDDDDDELFALFQVVMKSSLLVILSFDLRKYSTLQGNLTTLNSIRMKLSLRNSISLTWLWLKNLMFSKT
ncbi:hypothetical protein Ahia01_001135300, partial [Argonauta hians]